MGKSPQTGESPKPLKPIIKITAVPKVDSDTNDDDDKHFAGSRKDDRSRLGTISDFLAPWTGKRASTGDAAHIGSMNSINTIGSLSNHRFGKRRVRFRDRESMRSISALSVRSRQLEVEEKVVESFPNTFQLFGIDDPTYLPGFADLNAVSEVIVSESVYCYCNLNSDYYIKDANNKVLYFIDKEDEGCCASCCKWLCLCNYDLMRAGFTINIFNAAISTQLVTFSRKTHWVADQLDIVETFYSIEHSHVGRIEKTSEGYRIMDTDGLEAYIIKYEKKVDKTMISVSKRLEVFHSETKDLAAVINFSKRRLFGTFLPARNFNHHIKWFEKTDVAAKVLMIGVLMLELNSEERFVDLPLGKDAVVDT